MSPKTRHFTNALVCAAKTWWKKGHADSAAALAFYSVFSLVPLLLLSIQVASLVIDAKLANQELQERIAFYAGNEIAEYVAKLIENNSEPLSFSLASAFSLIVIFVTSSRVVSKLRDTLNGIFGMTKGRRKRAIILNTVLGRLLSVALVSSIGVIIAVSAMASVAFESISNFLADQFPNIPWASFQLGILFKSVIAFLLVAVLLSLTFRWLPRNPPKSRYALIGACVASVGFMTLERALSLYFKFASFGGAFSGAITLILLLFWIYCAMQIVLYGAEVTRALRDSEESLVTSEQ